MTSCTFGTSFLLIPIDPTFCEITFGKFYFGRLWTSKPLDRSTSLLVVGYSRFDSSLEIILAVGVIRDGEQWGEIWRDADAHGTAAPWWNKGGNNCFPFSCWNVLPVTSSPYQKESSFRRTAIQSFSFLSRNVPHSFWTLSSDSCEGGQISTLELRKAFPKG